MAVEPRRRVVATSKVPSSRAGIETGKRISSNDVSGLFRQPLRTHDYNPGLNETPTASDYLQSVSQRESNKRRFDAIDDRFSAEQPKPMFYRNQTAIAGPSFSSVTAFQSMGRDIYSKDGALQCPYTGRPRTFEIFTQYDEMKAHYAHHANQRAESEIRRGHSYPIELENVNGSGFSFAPKRYTPEQGDWPPLKPVSPRHKTNPSAKSRSAHNRRTSSEPHNLPFPIAKPVARTIYDVPHPSRAPLPKAAKTSSPERHGPGRTIYDVQHPTARRSQRLAGKGSGGGGAQSKSKLP
ncbi:hypothetical protein F5146DRAFT_1001575 [Armillaria mellea]|nr:hypothetical protein F5146DRAFT_1001575 [Armillaria mellea]